MRGMKFRPRFSLRTLLVLIALISIPLGWLAYQLNWIRERHKMLTQELPREYQEYREYNKTQPAILRPAPWPLRIFGEQGIVVIGVPKSQAERAAELFPEAAVAIFLPE
jgi:hypothetical protein